MQASSLFSFALTSLPKGRSGTPSAAISSKCRRTDCFPFPAPFPLLILVHSGGSKALPDVPLETGLCLFEAKTYIVPISDPLHSSNQLPLWLQAAEPPVVSSSSGITSADARAGLAGAAQGCWGGAVAH